MHICNAFYIQFLLVYNQSTITYLDVLNIISYHVHNCDCFCGICMCSTFAFTVDGLQYLTLLFCLFYNCVKVTFLLYFFFCLLESLHEDLCFVKGKVLHSRCHGELVNVMMPL